MCKVVKQEADICCLPNLTRSPSAKLFTANNPKTPKAAAPKKEVSSKIVVIVLPQSYFTSSQNPYTFTPLIMSRLI